MVDKPLNWTSFDVVKKIRGQIKVKIGHAGTLDPRATGLLILCTGRYTKKINEYQGLPKEYVGTFKLGATTPSYDTETEEMTHFPITYLTEEAIHAATSGFLGEIEQTPPIYSAIKVKGVRLYKKARKGQKVEIKKRKIKIEQFDITAINLPWVKFKIRCSPGTYIRSIAHDFGLCLDNGAYLYDLCRTKIGDFHVEDAWNLQELVAHLKDLSIHEKK